MSEHSLQEFEIARTWLRRNFQIPLSKDDPKLNAILDDTENTISALLSPKQKKKYREKLPLYIADLRQSLSSIVQQKLTVPSVKAEPHGWALDEASVLRMEQLIQESESCFASLGETVRSKKPGKPHIPALFLPFDLVKKNETFPHKNGIPLRIRTREITLNQGNFIYDLLPASVVGQKGETMKLVAAFYARFRQLQIPVDYDPHRLFDLFIKYHEVWHAQQDDWLRMRYGSVVQTLYEKKAHIMDFECEAYAYMVELLDLYTDGGMQARCKNKITDKDIDWLHKILQGRPGHEIFSKHLLMIGRRLWHVPGYHFTGQDNVYPAEYERYIIANHPGPHRWKIDHSTGDINKIP